MGAEQQPTGGDPSLPRSEGRRFRFWATATPILILACVLRFWALDLGLPHRLARPDEDDVLRMTLLPAQGDFDLGWSVYPSAYVYLSWLWVDAGLRAGAAVGLHPSVDYVEGYRRDPAYFLLIARALSAAAGTAAVLLLMLLARRALGDPEALATGLLLATNFLHARDSHAAKPDALLSLGVTAAFLAMLPLSRRATLRTGALAGLGVGAAMAIKYPAVLLLIPVYVAAVGQSATRGWRRLLPRPAIAAGLVAAVVFLATSPYILLSPESRQGMENTVVLAFPSLFPERNQQAMTQFDLAQTAAPISEYGSAAWWGGLLYQARFSLWYGAGKLASLLAPLAVLWGILCRRPIPLLATAFIVPYFLVVGLSIGFVARYMTPLLPPLLLLEAGMLYALARRLAGRQAGIVFALAVAVVAAEPLYNAVAHNRIAARTDTRVLASRWLQQHPPDGARVAVYGTQFYPWGAPKIPRRLTPVEVDPAVQALAEKGVGYLVTHDHDLFYSTVDPETMARLAPRLRLEAEFRPFDPAGAAPIFETADAYYIPFHDFAGVERPGPHVKIHRFE